MYSKWSDACGQILAFDRLDDITSDIASEVPPLSADPRAWLPLSIACLS